MQGTSENWKTKNGRMSSCLTSNIDLSFSFFFSALRMHKKKNNFYTNTLHLVTCWDAVHTTIFNHTREFVEGCSRDGLKHVKNHVRVSSCVMEGVDCVHLVSWCKRLILNALCSHHLLANIASAFGKANQTDCLLTSEALVLLNQHFLMLSRI